MTKLLQLVNQTSLSESEVNKSYVYESSEISCKYTAIDYLKQDLKNPLSLQIHDVSSTKDGYEYTFIFDYSAMNSFGGYTRSTFICIVDSKTNTVTSAFAN